MSQPDFEVGTLPQRISTFSCGFPTCSVQATTFLGHPRLLLGLRKTPNPASQKRTNLKTVQDLSCKKSVGRQSHRNPGILQGELQGGVGVVVLCLGCFVGFVCFVLRFIICVHMGRIVLEASNVSSLRNVKSWKQPQPASLETSFPPGHLLSQRHQIPGNPLKRSWALQHRETESLSPRRVPRTNPFSGPQRPQDVPRDPAR